jgi:hypothetical protein
MKKFLLLYAFLFIAIIAIAQPVSITTGTLTPQQLVQDSLVTGCVDAFSITYTGNAAGIGYFNAIGTSFDSIMSSGIVLASGPVVDAVGPNNSGSQSTGWGSPGDNDLNSLITQTTNDAAVLEFDFIPASDTLEFKYVFGSEEYLEYVNSSFNDVFAFFLSGPNPLGGSYANENVAIVPGTTVPVSINNVNNASYPQYYINNGTGSTPNNEALEYDGYTIGMYARASVIACQTYHIKLAVADAGDTALDSGVFIEAGSFTDGSQVTINNVNPTGTQNDLYEGCISYYVFMRQDTTDTTDPVTIPLGFGGTATNGVDLTAFPTNVVIPSGQISDTIAYTVFNDGITEPTEIFIIDILAGCPCNPTPTSDTITLYDFTEFKASIVNTDSLFCGTIAPPSYDITATCVTHPDWFIDYAWNTGSADTFITITPPLAGSHDIYWCEVSDICGNSIRDSITIGVSNLSGVNAVSSDALCYGVCNGTSTATPFSIGSTPGKFYRWSDLTTTTPTGVRNNLCWGNYTVTVTDNSYCEFSDNFTISQPSAALDASSGILPFDTTYCESPGQIEMVAFANISDVTFTWNGGVPSTSTENVNPLIGINTYYVDITDFCGFKITDTVHVLVSEILNSSLISENTSCYQFCDGEVEVNTPLGIPPYLYQWSSNGLGNFTTYVNTLDSLCPDTFTLSVVDYAGCIYQDNFIIEEPEEFDPEDSYIATSDTMWCGTTPPTSIQLAATSNLNNVDYLWSTGETTEFINITPVQGTSVFTVQVSDNCGNSTTDEINIVVSSLSGFNSNLLETTCYNSCDGEITVSPTGGITPYEYIWNPSTIGSTNSNVASNLCSGTYSVMVRDAGGCEFTENFTIVSPANINECYITNVDTLFCGGVTVPPTITIETSINSNVSYNWNTSEIGSNITFVPQTGANIYWVDFTDDCGNVHRDSIVFSVSDFVGANILPSAATCFGSCDGSVMITPIFGMSPYTYEWNVPGVGTTSVGLLTDVCGGSYSVTVSDLAKCFAVKTFLILQPDSITFDFVSHDSFGAVCDGFATATNPQGGTSPYTYLWDDPNAQTTYNAQNLCPGLYTVEVFDAKGCFNSDTIRVLDLTGISEDFLTNLVKVYPNPSSGNFVVDLNQLADKAETFTVFDLSGKVIYLRETIVFEEGTTEINNLPAGVHILQIELSNKSLLQKKLIVVE